MSHIPVVLFVGLIGSGKSTVLAIFKGKGAQVIFTDALWKREIYKDSNRSRLLSVFGEDVLLENGKPNLERLRTLLFSVDKTKQVECLLLLKRLHLEFDDLFFSALKAEIERVSSFPGVTMVIIESALALTNDWDKKIKPDCVVSLHCPEDVRLQRILKRDPDIGLPIHLAIMSMQPSDESHHEMSEKVGALRFSTHSDIKNMPKRSIPFYKQIFDACNR